MSENTKTTTKMSKRIFYVNYSDKGRWGFPRASLPCTSLEAAQIMVKVYKVWSDRKRLTITEKPSGKVYDHDSPVTAKTARARWAEAGEVAK